MAKLRSIKGFALLETMIVLLIISTLLLSTPYLYQKDFEVYDMISNYAYQQFLAIKHIEKRAFHADNIYHYYPITFNEKGNINLSQTISFKNRFSDRSLVIYLGGGRIEIKS